VFVRFLIGSNECLNVVPLWQSSLISDKQKNNNLERNHSFIIRAQNEFNQACSLQNEKFYTISHRV